MKIFGDNNWQITLPEGWVGEEAVAMAKAGADILVLRHPESVRRVKAAIDDLMTVPEIETVA